MESMSAKTEKISPQIPSSRVKTGIPEQAKVGRIPVGGRELGLVNLIDLVQEGIDKLAPRRVVVDSISDLVFRFPNIEERRPAVLDIVEVLQSTGTTCLLTSELPST